MPQKTGNAPPTPESTAELRVQIATSLQAARARTGMSRQQVVDQLARQGLEIAVTTLERWESTGLINVDAAAQLAAAYGTTIDTLAGRRAFREQRRAPESHSPDRSSC
jgi:FAD/FMN-containing dehydrogenase